MPKTVFFLADFGRLKAFGPALHPNRTTGTAPVETAPVEGRWGESPPPHPSFLDWGSETTHYIKSGIITLTSHQAWVGPNTAPLPGGGNYPKTEALFPPGLLKASLVGPKSPERKTSTVRTQKQGGWMVCRAARWLHPVGGGRRLELECLNTRNRDVALNGSNICVSSVLNQFF